MIKITSSSFPAIHLAMVSVEVDNGGHLIGTVYPGEPIDLDTFVVPDAWEHLVAPAEAGLARLLADVGPDEFVDWVNGEQGESDALAAERGDLVVGSDLINAWFNDWETVQ